MKKVIYIVPSSHLLVNKKNRKFHRRFPPLEALIIGPLLKSLGIAFEVLDLNADPNLAESTVLEKSKVADAVILTTNPYADWQCPSFSIGPAIELAKQLEGQKLIITGNHGTHFPKGIIELTGAAVVVREEPEVTIRELLSHLNTGGSAFNLKSPGISFRSSNIGHKLEVVHNPSRTLEPMDQLPSPDYSLINLDHYQYELLGDRFALLEASRGCPYSCNFCNRSMFQNKYRKKSFDVFKLEVEELVEKYKAQSLYVFDLEFTINRPLVEAFCNFLIEKKYAEKKNFKWACQTRADSVDEELLKLMKRSGCELVHFGVEAGSAEILKSTGKRITREEIKKGVEAARKAKVKSAGFFILGHPNETESDLQATLNFALSLNLTYVSFHPLIPFPGSPLFEKQYGPSPYWDREMPTNWSYFTEEREQLVNKYVRKAYISYYLRPMYVAKLLFAGDSSLYLRQARLFWRFLFPAA